MKNMHSAILSLILITKYGKYLHIIFHHMHAHAVADTHADNDKSVKIQ